MQKLSSQILSHLADPSVLKPMLATAGASGLLGGYLTSQTPQRSNETSSGRRNRIIRNALLTAAAGGGAVAAGATAFNQMGNALPANDVDQITQKVTSPLARVGYGAGTWGMLNKNVGGTTGERASAMAGITKAVKGQLPADLGKTMKDTNIKTVMRDPGQAGDIRTALASAQPVKNTGGAQNLSTAPVGSWRQMDDLGAAGLPQGEGGAAVNMARAARYRLFGLRGSSLAKDGAPLLPPIARTALSAAAGYYGPDLVGSAIGAGKDMFLGGDNS